MMLERRVFGLMDAGRKGCACAAKRTLVTLSIVIVLVLDGEYVRLIASQREGVLPV